SAARCWNTSGFLVDGLHRASVAAEETCRRELAELVSNHVLRHVNRDELVAVVDREGVTDEIGDDRACPRPRLDHALLVPVVHRRDFRHEGVCDVRTLLNASRHYRFSEFGVTALPCRASVRGR